ncbi:MAG: response regulator [Planctomycetes bacterium]|nr:response regulator [Planctomycetota bacterium]
MSERMILLVEDNASNRKLFTDILEYQGYTVVQACDVGEALRCLAVVRPDLVLTDIQVPGGGGELLLARVRDDPSLAATPVIAVTAYAMPGDRERLLAIGFDGYIGKPIQVLQFIQDIQALLSAREGAATAAGNRAAAEDPA